MSHPSFTSRQASLAIQKLPTVASAQGADNSLLLVEQLVAKLGPGVAYLSPPDIATLAWALAKVGDDAPTRSYRWADLTAAMGV
jgi:hypothetical protein